MASSLEHFCLIKDSVTLGLNREVINMKKKFWLTLYNIGVSILFLLSLYSYAKGMAGFSLFLALAVFGEIAARAFMGSMCMRRCCKILAGESRDKRGYSLSNHESIAIAF
jgi:hypothetical protein